MTKNRTVQKIITGENSIDGAGVHLTRVFGFHQTKLFDPFLMLDAFDSTNPNDYVKGFPWHPHRGIETITYLIQGDIEHGDSLENKGRIRDGDCQWMTAGAGIVHQEMPQPSRRLFGVQLWLNLPSRSKMVVPKYNDILQKNIPLKQESGTTVRVIAGVLGEMAGAFQAEYVSVNYFDVTIQSGQSWSFATPAEATVFVYILEGSACFGTDRKVIKEKHVALFNHGEMVSVRALDHGVRFLFLSGMPLREPIAWGGPIVMNTREELRRAFQEINDGNFISS